MLVGKGYIKSETDGFDHTPLADYDCKLSDQFYYFEYVNGLIVYNWQFNLTYHDQVIDKIVCDISQKQ